MNLDRHVSRQSGKQPIKRDNGKVTHPDRILLASRIHAALPQTQCTRCGYPDCMAYAEAIAQGGAAINQCPPGGAEGVTRLAAITGRPALSLNPANGVEAPRSVAVIDEAWCIGCTLCLPVCPTDAILGGNKMMHTVIEPHCTGCELCIAVCPVDCISLENVTGELTGWAAWSQVQADQALERYAFHSLSRLDSLIKTPKLPLKLDQKVLDSVKKQSVIEAALARSRAARVGQKPS
ncbi:MAG: electron transport complex subunit RsxB [Polaromonas sp.]|nr:electron transport complex subunit RsxB [Polaromonas sp.]